MREPLWHMYRHIIIALVERKRYFNCTWTHSTEKEKKTERTNKRKPKPNWIVDRSTGIELPPMYADLCSSKQEVVDTNTMFFECRFTHLFIFLLHTNMNLYVQSTHAYYIYTYEMYFSVYVPSSLEYLCIPSIEHVSSEWWFKINRLNIFFLFPRRNAADH